MHSKIFSLVAIATILFLVGSAFAASANETKQKPVFEFPHFEFSLRPLLEFTQEQLDNLQAGLFKLQPGVPLNRYTKGLPYIQQKLKQNPITFAKKELAGYNTVNVVKEVFKENKERVAKLGPEDYIEINETLLEDPAVSKDILEDVLKDRTMTQAELDQAKKEIEAAIARSTKYESNWQKNTIIIGGKTYTAGELSKMNKQETAKIIKQKELDDLAKQRKAKQKIK